MSVAWTAYRIAAPCLGAIAPAARWLANSKERALWGERMGDIRLPGGCSAWVHGASLGEATAVIPLVRELARLDSGARFCLTATTRAGRARLAASGLPAHLAPIDAPQAVRRFFEGVRPRRAWIVETELWPHWLLRAREQRVPVGIVSARLSDRSLRQYQRLGRELRALIAGLDAVLCQSDDDRRRWLALGAPEARTAVVGNLKIDALPSPAASRADARHALGLDPARPLLVLGSVRPGELGPIARAWRGLPDALRERWQVAAVPRHARASLELREEAQRARQPIAAGADGAPDAWHWDDRSGVLNDYYAAADVAFVGGSLKPYGGHNPLEPAACGAAVLIGVHHASQLAVVRALQRTDGVSVVGSEAELAEALELLLGDAPFRARQVAAADRALADLRGAARRAVARLVEWGLWPAS